MENLANDPTYPSMKPAEHLLELNPPKPGGRIAPKALKNEILVFFMLLLPESIKTLILSQLWRRAGRQILGKAVSRRQLTEGHTFLRAVPKSKLNLGVEDECGPIRYWFPCLSPSPLTYLFISFPTPLHFP